MCDSDPFPFCGERVKFIDKWWPKLLLCHGITRITISYSSERVDSVSLLCNRESVRAAELAQQQQLAQQQSGSLAQQRDSHKHNNALSEL